MHGKSLLFSLFWHYVLKVSILDICLKLMRPKPKRSLRVKTMLASIQSLAEALLLYVHLLCQAKGSQALAGISPTLILLECLVQLNLTNTAPREEVTI